eukprot:TRINITY_DN2606_c0_g2_i3.p1 TRINITY_DN2606_c0_g2~~TRINITY_DN2606_c0_g2_i3.p1  ORF type:complete len:137 (+),score=11.37 TRINITY_DN2606_c0_g2_i3:200-610(+)
MIISVLIFAYQGIEKSLRTDCVSHMEPSQCFFPKQIIENIKTPLFIVHSAYDVWQIQHILVPDAADPHNQWFKCKMDIRDCSSDQIKRLHGCGLQNHESHQDYFLIFISQDTVFFVQNYDTQPSSLFICRIQECHA